MFNLKLILSISLLVLNFILPQSTFAHILKTDRAIGAVLHIDPNDNPIAGQPAGIFLEFKDTQNKLKVQNCDCVLTIMEDGKQFFSQPLFKDNQSPSLSSAIVFYTFPEPNVYQIVITGKPLAIEEFQPFKLSYDVRVEKGLQPKFPAANTTSPNWFLYHSVHLIGAAILFLFIIVLLLKKRLFKSNS